MTKKSNPESSSLVKAVVALDNYLTELERVGTKINSADMTSDFDVEYIQKLMTRFAECGQGVSEEVTKLSLHLHEARARAEAVAQGVSSQAELFNNRRNEQNEKWEQFRVLGERVRELNAAIGEFRSAKGHGLTPEERSKLSAEVPAFDAQLAALIHELQDLRKSARDSRMRSLEKNVESLIQTLQAVQTKFREMRP